MAICQCFSPQDRDKLHHYTTLSRRENVEYGAPLETPCHVGEVVRGRFGTVSFPLTPSAIGSFHTHPVGEGAVPSQVDISEFLAHRNQVMCIGSRTEVSCFTPSRPEYVEALSTLVRMLREDIEGFRTSLVQKHGSLTMKDIDDREQALRLKHRADKVAEIQRHYGDYLGKCNL